MDEKVHDFEALVHAERDLVTSDLTIRGLRQAVIAALLELGVPDENYSAPVANAVTILRDALAADFDKSRNPKPPNGENLAG